jgi:hypothetical protein
LGISSPSLLPSTYSHSTSGSDDISSADHAIGNPGHPRLLRGSARWPVLIVQDFQSKVESVLPVPFGSIVVTERAVHGENVIVCDDTIGHLPYYLWIVIPTLRSECLVEELLGLQDSP